MLRELDEDALREALEGLDCEAVAVCLLWGFRHPEHERRVAELAAEVLGGVHVSTSHETAGVFREYERCVTTIVDAALSPLLRGYLERLTERAEAAGLPEPEVMLSSGGTAGADTAARHASWTVLSGPAGGAVGAAHVAGADAPSGWTWAARPATCRCCSAARRPSAAGAASAAVRWRCRWWTCTRSAPAAARSRGATPAVPCAWGRARPGPIPGQPATGAAGPSRR